MSISFLKDFLGILDNFEMIHVRCETTLIKFAPKGLKMCIMEMVLTRNKLTNFEYQPNCYFGDEVFLIC